jgi:hypothetical protein
MTALTTSSAAAALFTGRCTSWASLTTSWWGWPARLLLLLPLFLLVALGIVSPAVIP